MSTAVSQETTDDTEERFGEIEEIVVEGSLRSLPTEDVGSVFGFGKTLLETPRSASTISSDQMDRFDMRDIDELIALAPGTFTQSFFGVAGSLDVRGTSGETYFRGVRRLDNPGNYPTPIAASDRVDIVRGPASVVYGPAKMGGYLNFVPKSARASGGQYLSEPEGRLSYTTGSWRKSVVSAEVGGPGSIGGKDFGYHLYAEVENSGSYYRSSETNQTVIQASFDSDLTDKTRIAFGGMYHYFDGNQNAGWNRLTQDLIDTGTYITGSPAPLDLNGDGEIAHLEYFIGGIGFFFGDPSQVTPADLTPNMALLNPGTTILDRRNVVVADDDVLENEVTTLYFDIIHETDGGWEIKNQLFFETYNNLNENAYGFSQFHNSYVIEEKLVLSKVFESGSLTTSLQLSPSLRYTDFEHGDDFINEFFDRRDLTGPSTALDRRRLSTRSGINYSTFQVGDYLNLGLGAIADFTWESGFSVLLGLRYDSVDAESTDIDSRLGPLFGSGADNPVDDTENGISWTASVSYETEAGIIPYITASEQSTTIAGQGAEIDTGLLASGSWFDVSELLEFGVKTSFLDDTLYMALAVYTQERTDFSAQSTVTNQSNETEGVEFELRWAVNDNLLVTAGYSNIEIINLNTIENGGRFSFYGAEDLPQIDPTLYFGGQFAGTVTLSDDSQAIRAGIPENIFSFTGTYGWDNGWAVNASVVAVDSVFSGFSQAVRLPSYTLVNLGVIYEADDWSISLTGKNLTDEEYFRANFPNLFGSQIVLPELPRNYQASFTYNF
ncbi:MAG: TonB-dependent receptor [Pseudomonadota bacterium]